MYVQMSRSILYHAIEVGNSGALTQLLKHKADPNVADEVRKVTVWQPRAR
jgi:hypothetical protein